MKRADVLGHILAIVIVGGCLVMARQERKRSEMLFQANIEVYARLKALFPLKIDVELNEDNILTFCMRAQETKENE